MFKRDCQTGAVASSSSPQAAPHFLTEMCLVPVKDRRVHVEYSTQPSELVIVVFRQFGDDIIKETISVG